MRTGEQNMIGVNVLELINKATYIKSKNFNKWTPPKRAMENRNSNSVGPWPKVLRVGPKAQKSPTQRQG